MKIVVAIDSFKGSLSSLEAGNAVKEAALRVNAKNEVIVCPLADGGEGTVEALTLGLGGQLITVTVQGPLQQPTEAVYGYLPERHIAIVEMSAAAGITLVDPDERNPLHTTTYGVGELIADAISRGCRDFIIGIGGSATNDGGIGMLSALGFEFLDSAGHPVPLGAKGLETLHTISCENVLPQLVDCRFRIACDVTNPLCGPNGCSAVYGPQKGATAAMIAQMDAWLSRYATLAASVSSTADSRYPGAGAAGGLGFAFLAFTNATLESGIQIVLRETKLEDHIRFADLVITGEGRLDSQTVMGKAPVGVAKLAKQYQKPVLAFSGCVSEDAAVCNEHGIDAFFPIVPGVVTLEEALDRDNAYRNLYNTAYQALRLKELS